MNSFRSIGIGIGMAIGLGSALATGPVMAQQDWPTRPVRIIVPYGPGSGVDVVVRALNEGLSRNLGQNVIAENRVGASGTIAASHVLAQAADGYTLLSDSSSHTIVPALMDSLQFNMARDFRGVTTLIENPLVLVTSPAKGFKDLKALIASAKAKPGSITFASAGIGSSTHLSAEKFRLSAGWDGVHVPFKSTTDALIEVSAGRIDFVYTALASAISGMETGKLQPLAMLSRRVDRLPNVPAVAEIVPGAEYSTWIGIFVPSKTPDAVVSRLHAEIVKVMHSPEMKARLATLGSEPWTMSPAEFDKMRALEFEDNVRLVKAAGIRK
jgi:tripartite-type tricarboxylate transporter receptor subunit TctC